MSNNQNKNNYKNIFCLSVLSFFFAAGNGYAGPQSQKNIDYNSYDNLFEGATEIHRGARSEGDFTGNMLDDFSSTQSDGSRGERIKRTVKRGFDNVRPSDRNRLKSAHFGKENSTLGFAGPMESQHNRMEGTDNENNAHVENDWGNYLRNLLPAAPSWDDVKHSAEWVKENSWDKLPSLESVKHSAERVKESAQPVLSYAYDTAGSALNKLSSGAGSAWSYLFGENDGNLRGNPEKFDENDAFARKN